MRNHFASLQVSYTSRRKFLTRAAQSAGVLALGWQPVFGAAGKAGAAQVYTVQDIMDLVLKAGKLAPIANTVDTLKAGTASQQVTGIVTTMFATVAVIEAAAKQNANFIIAHEPTFYNHTDNTSWVKDNAVVQQKQELLAKHHMAVWRFHDYCHDLQPDAISYGVVRKAGWLSYFNPDNRAILTVPALSLKQLALHLKTSLGIAHVRFIGDPEQSCARIALLPGAWGGQRQVGIAETEKPDVLVVGELSEWETAEYIRDAQLMGKKIALVVLGHGVSEDPGMEWLVQWLHPILPGLNNITHIASGDPFTWL